MTNTVSRFTLAAAATIALNLTLAISSASAAEIGQTGQFFGQSNHITKGTVTIDKVGGTTYVVLGDDFSLDGAPAPTLGFSINGTFVDASEFAELQSLTGAQRYALPATLDIADFDAFVVWCADFDVPLGSAILS